MNPKIHIAEYPCKACAGTGSLAETTIYIPCDDCGGSGMVTADVDEGKA